MATGSPTKSYVDITDNLVSLIYKAIIDDWINRDIKCAEYRTIVLSLYRQYTWEIFSLSLNNDRNRYNNILTNVFSKLNTKIRAKQQSSKKKHRAYKYEVTIMNGATNPEERWYEDMQDFLLQIGQHICPIEGLPKFEVDPA